MYFTNLSKRFLSIVAAVCLLAGFQLAQADSQEIDKDQAAESQASEQSTENTETDIPEGVLEEIVVLGERLVVRNRTDTVEPILSYDGEYFERFEPLTVSDMLKRVPGVFFDQLLNQPQGTNGDGSPRSQVPRLRNLDASYSQILLNGRKVAGIDLGTGGGDFFGAIPAEAVQEVQVIRSPSAEIGSSGVGMTLNIILKDGARYQSNTWRAAGISYDGDFSGLASLQLAGSNDSYTYNLGLTYQDRPSGSTTKRRALTTTTWTPLPELYNGRFSTGH